MPEAPKKVITPELIKLADQLEAIFAPHAHAQRITAYNNAKEFGNGADEQDLRMVHYTSAEAALKIIQTKRIWFRNTTCMSDYREVEHGFAILKNYFSDDSKMRAFTGALDEIAPGCAREAIDRFDKRWNHLRFNIYVISASEHAKKENDHGRLSMWRAFGGGSARVALVLRIPKHSEAAMALNLFFSPVAYLTETEAHAELDKVTQNIASSSSFLRSVPKEMVTEYVFNTLLANVICLKHEGFQEEREWRAIYTPTLRESKLVASSTQVSEGIPQLVYELPLDVTHDPILADLDFPLIFERLIIGPSQYPWAMFEAFVLALVTAGVSDPGKRISNSLIPIRT